MRQILIHHLSLLLGLVLLNAAGCAQRPTDRIMAAEQLVAQTKTGHAATYAVEDVRRLERLLAALTTAVEEEDTRIAVLRDYGHADLLATAILHDARQVIRQAARRHDEAKATAAAALQEAREAMDESRRLIAVMKKQRRFGGIRRQAHDTEALSVWMTSAQQALDDEDYLGAEARARAITAHAGALSGQIQSIAARMGETIGPQVAQN